MVQNRKRGEGEEDSAAAAAAALPKLECLYGLSRRMKGGETNKFRGLFSERMAVAKQANKRVRWIIPLNVTGWEKKESGSVSSIQFGPRFRWSRGCLLGVSDRRSTTIGWDGRGRTPATAKWFARERCRCRPSPSIKLLNDLREGGGDRDDCGERFVIARRSGQ